MLTVEIRLWITAYVVRRHNDYFVIVIIIGEVGIEIFVELSALIAVEVLVLVRMLFVIEFYLVVTFTVGCVPVMSFISGPLFRCSVRVTVVVGTNVTEDISVFVYVLFLAVGLNVVSASGRIPVVSAVRIIGIIGIV